MEYLEEWLQHRLARNEDQAAQSLQAFKWALEDMIDERAREIVENHRTEQH